MGDVAKGIKSFKKGMAEDEPATACGRAEVASSSRLLPREAEKAKS